MDTPESIEETSPSVRSTRHAASGESVARLTTAFNELSDAFIKFSVAYEHVKQELDNPER